MPTTGGVAQSDHDAEVYRRTTSASHEDRIRQLENLTAKTPPALGRLLWAERSDVAKLETLRQEVRSLRALVTYLLPNVEKLVRHQHNARGEVVVELAPGPQMGALGSGNSFQGAPHDPLA